MAEAGKGKADDNGRVAGAIGGGDSNETAVTDVGSDASKHLKPGGGDITWSNVGGKFVTGGGETLGRRDR